MAKAKISRGEVCERSKTSVQLLLQIILVSMLGCRPRHITRVLQGIKHEMLSRFKLERSAARFTLGICRLGGRDWADQKATISPFEGSAWTRLFVPEISCCSCNFVSVASKGSC